MKVTVTLEIKKGDGPKQSFEGIEGELESQLDGLVLYVQDEDHEDESDYEVSFIKAELLP